MPIQKLPKSSVVLELINKKGLSYTEVGRLYGADYTTVARAYKIATIESGGQWPVKRTRVPADYRAFNDMFVDSTFIRESLREAYNEAAAALLKDTVMINAARRRDLRFHQDGCTHMLGKPMTVCTRAEVEAMGYEACYRCCHLSIRQWVEDIGLGAMSQGHMARLLSFADHPQARRIRKTTAIRLMKAIGEDVHWSVEEWAPIKHKRPAA